MRIDNVNKRVCGSSTWNQCREPGEELCVDLNIGSIDDDLQDEYVRVAEETLNDDMTDDEVQDALSHDIWEEVCNR